jgi:hypothetical protein
VKRTAFLLALASLSAGCFGACGSSESRSATPSSAIETPPATTTSGADTTTSTTTEPSGPTIVDSTDACTSDADCVPGGCCHPATCVARANAPACGDSVCTTDCRYGTLDCGGSCLCHAGHCAAQLSQLPNIPGVGDVH